MAKRLEESLSKRADSEPPSAPSSIRSLNITYMARMEKKLHPRETTTNLPWSELQEEEEEEEEGEDPIGDRVS